MIILALTLLCIATVPLARGRLSALGEISVRWGSLLIIALAIQVLIISIIPSSFDGIHAPAHLVSYALAAIFFVMNRHIYGLWIVALGGGLNLLVIAANGGVMPSSAPAAAERDGFSNAAALENARLDFLGDVFAMPAHWPLANAFSVGDVLIVAGIFIVLHAASGSSLGRRFPRMKSTRAREPRVG